MLSLMSHCVMSRTRSGLVSWDWEGVWWWRVLCLRHRVAPRGGA